jgi:hypothetical protein
MYHAPRAITPQRPRKKNIRARDLNRHPRSPHRRLFLPQIFHVLSRITLGSRLQRRPDDSRSHTIHPDAPRSKLLRQRARHRDDGALGGGVVAEFRVAGVAGDGGGVDDGGAALHVRDGVLDDGELGDDV